ncbi:hypothetical protein RB195_002445 [Necator americanus]|uniref:Endonuclease/exonuclease/phosphatase domain-containing protein n=1 Tax=Necator americanus TaxID=51031 RepID=A0ABR1DJJ4_NECAM
MDLEKFYREDHTFYKVIIGDFNAKKLSSLRWTWESPDGEYHNEIDYIIVSKRFCLTDVAVVPREAIKEDLMEKVIHDFYSDPFDTHVHLPSHHLKEDGHAIPNVLLSEVRHGIMSVKIRTSSGPDRIKFLTRKDATVQHLRAIGTNGSIAGARSSKSMNDEQGAQVSLL